MAGQAAAQNSPKKQTWQSDHVCAKPVALPVALPRQRLDIDNNVAERAVKPFVIGRKNWLFAKTVNGAEASAILYNLVETAKANDLKPYAWFRYVLSRIPQLPRGRTLNTCCL